MKYQLHIRKLKILFFIVVAEKHPLRVCIGNGGFLARGLLEGCLRIAHTESGYL